MATITNNSPIDITGGTLYLNDPDFESNLFFTDSNSSLYYMIISGQYVVTSGILQGYYNGTNYDYRFDFNNYIKIDNQSIGDFINIDNIGSFKFSGNNSCTLSFCLDTVDMIYSNITAGNLQRLSNGEVTYTSGHTISNIVSDNIFTYKFWDKVEGDDILIETNQVVEYNKYVIFTVYTGSFYYTIKDTNNNYILTLSSGDNWTSGYDYTVYMIRIPSTTLFLDYTIFDRNTVQLFANIIYAKCYGYTNYYFWNPNGTFDTLHCTGSDYINETVTKNSVQVGNRTIYTDIVTKKEIKQNTGFGLSQDQVYGLIKTPNVIKLNEIINYDGINLVNNSYRNLTINTYGIPFSDDIKLIEDQTYTLSMNGYISNEALLAGEVMACILYTSDWTWSTEIHINTTGTSTNSITFVAPQTDEYNIGIWRKPQSESSNSIHINWYKVEFGSVATPWKDSVDKYIPLKKEYTINDNTFDGYDYKKLGERNIELTFTDPKEYKRKTNKNITFFD